MKIEHLIIAALAIALLISSRPSSPRYVMAWSGTRSTLAILDTKTGDVTVGQASHFIRQREQAEAEMEQLLQEIDSEDRK